MSTFLIEQGYGVKEDVSVKPQNKHDISELLLYLVFFMKCFAPFFFHLHLFASPFRFIDDGILWELQALVWRKEWELWCQASRAVDSGSGWRIHCCCHPPPVSLRDSLSKAWKYEWVFSISIYLFFISMSLLLHDITTEKFGVFTFFYFLFLRLKAAYIGSKHSKNNTVNV